MFGKNLVLLDTNYMRGLIYLKLVKVRCKTTQRYIPKPSTWMNNYVSMNTTEPVANTKRNKNQQSHTAKTNFFLSKKNTEM